MSYEDVHGVRHHEMVEDHLLKNDLGLSGLQAVESSRAVPVEFVVPVEAGWLTYSLGASMFPCLLLSEDIRVACLSPVDGLPRGDENSSDHDAGACLVCGLGVKPYFCATHGRRSESLVVQRI